MIHQIKTDRLWTKRFSYPHKSLQVPIRGLWSRSPNRWCPGRQPLRRTGRENRGLWIKDTSLQSQSEFGRRLWKRDREREGLSSAGFYREDFGKWVKHWEWRWVRYIEVCLSQRGQYSADTWGEGCIVSHSDAFRPMGALICCVIPLAVMWK